MFGAKTSAPASGGLSINTSSANSLFSNAQTSTSQPATGGSLFGNQQKPAGSLFGNTTTTNTQPSGGSLFGGLGSNTTSSSTQQGGMTTGSLFGSTPATSQPQSGGLFGNTASKPATTGTSLFGNTTNTNTQQSGTATGGGLFGNTSNQQQSSGGTTGGSLFGNTNNQQQKPGTTGGSLFGNTNTAQTGTGGTSLFGGNQGTTQNKSLFGGGGTSLFGGATQNAGQQQQQQKPTLSIFGAQNTTQQQPQQSTAGQGTVVQGVRVDASNLLPTTKFESCADEIKKTIEQIDNYVLNQLNMCNEVSDLLPKISQQGSTVPNDVSYVEAKLDNVQHALENDARDINHVRNMVTRNAAEAQVAFRAIDNLKLPLQYQSSSGGWWSVPEQQLSERQSLRSSIKHRKSTLALPDGVEGDSSTADSIDGVPVNLVEYFSHRSDEMSTVLEGYKKNLKEIEDHLYGVESSLMRQINELAASRNRDNTANGSSVKSQLADLAAALGDVEAGILGVASRLGAAKEDVQELALESPILGLGRRN